MDKGGSAAGDKVGVTVVSGFLGSGKTTLLRRLVGDPELGSQLAVIVNDLGELGLDHELIAAASDTPTLRVTELTSGCVCCTLRSDLGTALDQLARGVGLPRPPRHILIEPSGVARASEVSFAINALGFDAPVRTDAVVTLVDAYNARRCQREHGELFADQLRSADLILLNKRDLVPDPAERAALEAMVAELAPRALVTWTKRSAIEPRLLLGDLDLASRRAPGARGADAHEHPPDEHAHDEEAHGIRALTVHLEPGTELFYLALEDFLDGQSDRIFRIKGLLDVVPADAPADAPATPHEVQAVGDRIEIDELPPGSALGTAPRRLIFIGDATTLAAAEAELRAGLSACARGGSRTRTPCG